MSSILNNDNFVSVIPRIIDPGMQFTKESIKNSNGKKLTETKTSKNVIPDKKENLDILKCPKENSFLSDYKYVILMIIICVIIVISIYFIYKYFDNKNNKIENNNLPVNQDNKLVEKDEKGEKDNNVKKYIATYIMEDEPEINEDEPEINEDEPKNNEDDPIICKEINNLQNTDNSRLILDPKIILGKEFVKTDTIIILGNNENKNLESENIDNLINSLESKENNNMNVFEELCTISENNDEINDDIEDNNNIDELDVISISENIDDDLNSDIDDDDLKYFKKFVQK